MDVHAETIAVAVAEPDGEVRSLGTIPNRMESVRKLIKKLGPVESCGSAMKRGRLATSFTGSWLSLVCSARWSPRRWSR